MVKVSSHCLWIVDSFRHCVEFNNDVLFSLGLEFDQLQAQKESLRSFWLFEYGYCFTWWFSLRIRWQSNIFCRFFLESRVFCKQEMSLIFVYIFWKIQRVRNFTYSYVLTRNEYNFCVLKNSKRETLDVRPLQRLLLKIWLIYFCGRLFTFLKPNGFVLINLYRLSGLQSYVVGLEWRQTTSYFGAQWHHYGTLFQSQPLLVVCCLWTVCKNLGQYIDGAYSSEMVLYLSFVTIFFFVFTRIWRVKKWLKNWNLK